MRITSVAQVRNDLLQLITDYLFSPLKGRSFLNTSIHLQSSYTHHPFTNRNSYTVPPNRRAIIKYVFIQTTQTVASSTLDLIRTTVSIKPFGGFEFGLLETYSYAQNLGDKSSTGGACNYNLVEGDMVRFSTLHQSLTGTTFHRGIVVIDEFDV